MEKYRKFLIGSQFAWLVANCGPGLEQVLDSSEIVGSCNSADNIHTDDARQDRLDELDHFVVVITKYPSVYGRNLGKRWSRVEMMERSTVVVSPYSYEEEDDADADANEIRLQNVDFFHGWPEQVCQPPFDSAKMKNYHHDEEILIRVMTRREFLQQQEKEEFYVAKKRERGNFEKKLKNEMTALQIRDSYPRIHYSNPLKQPFGKKADLEIIEEHGRFVMKNNREDSLTQVGSIMIEGRGLFRSLENGPIRRLISACSQYSSIEEVHIHLEPSVVVNAPRNTQLGDIPARFFEILCDASPFLGRTLKVLSLQGMKISPETLLEIGNRFVSLERLDVADTFSVHFYERARGKVDSMNVDELPYDSALIRCVENNKFLKRLDFGFAKREDEFFSYCMSRSLCDFLMNSPNYRLEVTMTDHRIPLAWTSSEAQNAAKTFVLNTIAEGTDNMAMRALALDALDECKVSVMRRQNLHLL